MEEIRCPRCRKFLGRLTRPFEIKCNRCKTFVCAYLEPEEKTAPRPEPACSP